jgi:hypothetical protein
LNLGVLTIGPQSGELMMIKERKVKLSLRINKDDKILIEKISGKRGNKSILYRGIIKSWIKKEKEKNNNV